MGAGLARATYDPHWSATLTATELRVLTYMALTALDVGRPGLPAELYYAGEGPLIIALTGDIPAHGSPAYRTQHRKVAGVLRRLVDVRAVERVRVGRRGARSAYRLTLDSHLQPLLPDRPQPVDNDGAGWG